MYKYLAFNKPFEVLSKLSDYSGRKTLKDFIPNKGVYTAGRLDYRSESLLILSNDGPMIQRLTHPHYCHPTKPDRDYHPTSWLKITLHEGKKHQSRRMTSAVRFPTLRLIRVSIGNIELGSLYPGEWRFLSNVEISQLNQELDFCYEQR